MLKKIFISLLILAASTPTPAVDARLKTHRNPTLTDSAQTPIKDVYVIHFILDGMNYDTMMAAIDKGRMPTLKKFFIDDGAEFKLGVSTFPSTSTSAYQSLVTGLLPGHSGIPHLQRFDRIRQEDIDYLSIDGYGSINGDLINLHALMDPGAADLDAPTIIFDLLKGYPTLSLYSSIRKGVTTSIPKIAPVSALWSTYVSERIENVDVLAYRDIIDIFGKPIENLPRYSLVGLYSSDITGHHFGAKSPEIGDILAQFDLFLNEFLALLDDRGIRDKTYIIVSADHGMHDTDSLFKFQDAVAKAGLAMKPQNPRDNNYTIYAADRGVSSTHLYTRRPDGTFAPLENPDELRRFPKKDGTTIDLIDFILSLEPTMLVMVRNGNSGTLIFAREGTGGIECREFGEEEWCSYRVLSGEDPLRLHGSEAIRLSDGTPHSSQQWLRATAVEEFPDAVVQLGTVFHDGRAGDIFIVPENSWGFRKIKHSTHGSIIRDDMHIPIFISGPTVPAGKYGIMRTVDVYPLLLKWFGIRVPKTFYDGRDPFEKSKAENSNLRTLARMVQTLAECRDPRDEGSLRSKTAPFPKGTDKAKVKRLAVMESIQRRSLSQRLEDYIQSLERERDDESSNAPAQRRYIEDHLAIAERAKRLNKSELEILNAITNAL